MVKYDSGSGVLEFSHVIPREGSEPFRSVDLAVCLKSLPEEIRQLIIVTAKVSSSHASEQKLTAGLKVETEDDKPTSLYVGDRFVKAISNYGKAKAEKALPADSKTE